MTATLAGIFTDMAPDSVRLARVLGEVARSRRSTTGQPSLIPEMFKPGSSELRQWFGEYGGDGVSFESRYPGGSSWATKQKTSQPSVLTAEQNRQSAETSSESRFVLSASEPETPRVSGLSAASKSQTKRESTNPTSPRSTKTRKTAGSQQDRATDATATSTTESRSAITASGKSSSAAVDVSVLSDAHRAAAAGWDDAEMCLEWAAENEATVREMVAWRKLRNAAS